MSFEPTTSRCDRIGPKYRHADILFLLAICGLFLLFNVRWIWLFRRGQPFEIDEAGYLGVSFVYFRALVDHGIVGWAKAVEFASISAPLTTALSSLSYLFLGARPLAGFSVPIAAGLVTISASYYLGKAVSGRLLAILTSLLVATSPIIIYYSRSYHFAVPATAVTTLALLALVRSNQFRSATWSLVFGLCLGLMPLARTMAIAFVPGLAFPAIVQVLLGPGNSRKQFILLAASFGIALLVAAIWLVPNGPLVFQYLVNFGYGSGSAEFGPPQPSFFEWHTLLYFVQNLGAYLYLPDLAFIAFGFGLLPFRAASCLISPGWRKTFRALLASKLFPAALLVIEGAVALASSPNKGSAFIAPLVPAMLLMSTSSLLEFSRRYSARWAVIISALAVSAISCLPFIDLRLWIARPWSVNVPLLGRVPFSDGRGVIQRVAAQAGYPTGDHGMAIDSATGSAWLEMNARTAQRLGVLGARSSPIDISFRHYFYNSNTINLMRLVSGQSQLRLIQIKPEGLHDSVSAYSAALTSGNGPLGCLLLTATGSAGETSPSIDSKHMEIAAQQTGFSQIEQWMLPDRGMVKLWTRHYPGCDVQNVKLGDVFGTVSVISADEIFVHPGQHTPTSLELTVDNSFSVIRLAIPESVLKSCPTANGVNVAIGDAANELWHGLVLPGRVVAVPLHATMRQSEKLYLKVDNNGDPACDHLYVKFKKP